MRIRLPGTLVNPGTTPQPLPIPTRPALRLSVRSRPTSSLDHRHYVGNNCWDHGLDALPDLPEEVVALVVWIGDFATLPFPQKRLAYRIEHEIADPGDLVSIHAVDEVGLLDKIRSQFGSPMTGEVYSPFGGKRNATL